MLSAATFSQNTAAPVTTQRVGLYTAGPMGTTTGSKGDTANISEAGRALNSILGTAPSVTPGDTQSGGRTLMSGTTGLGSSITLTAHQASATNGMRLGLADAQRSTSRFSLAGADPAGTPKMEYTATFAHADGSIQSFAVDGTTRFYQQIDGSVLTREGAGEDDVAGQSILINVADGATVKGGKGDDMVLNIGLNAAIETGEGYDTILSMGDGAAIDGGLDNDRVTILEDVLQRDASATEEDTAHVVIPSLSLDSSKIKDVFDEADKYESEDEDGKLRKPTGSQSVKVSGGEGNDTITVRATLYEAELAGGEGSDSINTGDMLQSRVDLGTGDDVLQMGIVMGSTILGGKGDDRITARLLKDSTLLAGSGDDTIKISGVENSLIDAGDGNDTLLLDELRNSTVLSGGGDDTISFSRASGSLINGGEGNDRILVSDDGKGVVLQDSRIEGGDGDDTIEISTGPDDKPSRLQDTTIDGGRGDDKISVRVDDVRLTAESLNSGPMVQGGEGNDRISVNIKNLWLPQNVTDVNGALAQGGAGENSLSLNVGKLYSPTLPQTAPFPRLERIV